MSLPPARSTARLRMEPLSLAYSAGMFALWSDERVCRHSGTALNVHGEEITLPALSPADSDQIIEFFTSLAQSETGFRWAVLDRARGDFIGAIGFNCLTPLAEIAYHLTPAAWGQGYAREAVAEALCWAFGVGIRRVGAWIEPDNERSLRLIIALGFKPTGRTSDGASQFVRRLDASPQEH